MLDTPLMSTKGDTFETHLSVWNTPFTTPENQDISPINIFSSRVYIVYPYWRGSSVHVHTHYMLICSTHAWTVTVNHVVCWLRGSVQKCACSALFYIPTPKVTFHKSFMHALKHATLHLMSKETSYSYSSCIWYCHQIYSSLSELCTPPQLSNSK